MSWPNPLFICMDPNLGTLDERPDIPRIIPESWDQLEGAILPAIRQRRLTEMVRGFTLPDESKPWEDYTVQTVVLDSFTHLGVLIKSELTKDGDKDMGYEGWDKYQGRLKKTSRVLTQSALYKPNAETYNAIGTIHEKVIFNEKGDLKAVEPTLQGGGGGDFFWSHWSNILACKKTLKQKGGGNQKEMIPSYVCYSVPPDKFRSVVLDTSQKLPPVLENGGTYPELAKFWNDSSTKEA